MRVAVCFSGQPRFIPHYAPLIKKHLLDLYDCDIYAHFWEHTQEPINMSFTDTYTGNPLDEFKTHYAYKALQTEPQVYFDISGYALDTLEPDLKHAYTPNQFKDLYQRVNSQWYSLQKCYKLIEEPDTYDFIVRIRTDCKLNSPIELSRFNKHTLYIQDGRRTGWDRKYADWFMLGHADVMSHFTNIYDSIYDYWHKGSIHIHKFIQSYVENKKIPNEPYEFNTSIETIHYKQKR